MRRLVLHWIYHQLLLDSMQLAEFPSSPELIGMQFVRLYLDLEKHFQESDHGLGFWYGS